MPLDLNIHTDPNRCQHEMLAVKLALHIAVVDISDRSLVLPQERISVQKSQEPWR